VSGLEMLEILNQSLLGGVPGPNLLAYGPAPGLELIPYFLALLAWVGMALLAVLISPIRALIRRLRGTGSSPPARAAGEPAPASQPESVHEGGSSQR
jgi:hypothetical protein